MRDFFKALGVVLTVLGVGFEGVSIILKILTITNDAGVIGIAERLGSDGLVLIVVGVAMIVWGGKK